MKIFTKLGFVEEKYYEFPNIINLEVFRGECPCSCVHCPVGKVNLNDREARFGHKFISRDLVHKVVDEMRLWEHSTIRLHSVGEPILWPHLIPSIKYIHDAGVRSWIFTSLVTKNKEILNALCEYCDIVEVSVNSVDACDYLLTKGVDAFDLVIDNIKYMSNYIDQNKLSTRLVVSRVQSDSVELDDLFVNYWKKTNLVADAFVRKYHNYNNLIESKGADIGKSVSCLVHWMRFNIAYNGVVVTCFNELFHPTLRNDVILGDINTQSIYDVWHGKELNELRQAELSGYVNSKYAYDFPCRNCFSCQPYDPNRETSETQINAVRKGDRHD